MKILYIDVNCKNSSTGKIVYDLFSSASKYGDEAFIAYGRGPLVKEDNILKFGLDWETRFHALMTRVTGFTGCFSYWSTLRLMKFIEKVKPDIIHIHELHAYFVNISSLLSFIKRKNIPVVWTFHCEFMYTGKCGHAFECEKWKQQCGKCPRLHDYPKTLFFDQTKRMFNAKKKALSDLEFTIVAPSHWLLNRVNDSFLKDKQKRVIPNGIDADVFKAYGPEYINDKYGLKDSDTVALTVGQNIFVPSKGGQRALLLAKKLPQVKFVIIGGNKDDTPLPNVLIIKETSDQRELAHWYSRANIFLMLSERENFPTTCLESQMCGTPVFGFDVGGVRETLTQFTGNRLFEFGGLDSIENDLINLVVKHPKKQEDALLLSRQTRAMFSKESMIENYYGLYQELTHK